MGLIGNMWGRAGGTKIRKEDDRTRDINFFFEDQEVKVESYTIRRIEKEWFVDVVGDVHLDNGEPLNFKFGEVSGNLVCHCRSISPLLLPEKLGGKIIFDVEDILKSAKSQDKGRPHKESGEEKQPENKSAVSTELSSDTEGVKSDEETPSLYNPYDSSLGCLLAVPNTDTKDGRKALKEKQQSLAQQLEDILWAIRYYDFPIDPKGIIEKVEQHSQDKEEDYKLSFDFGTKDEDSGQLSKCDIYVSPNKDAAPLNIKPIFKATYLAIMLMEKGINPSKPSEEFFCLVRHIYGMLPPMGQAIDDYNGILNNKKNFDSDWLGKQLNGIRNAVKEQIPNLLIAQKFAVEGYRNKPFTVQKADDSIRKQIFEAFFVD